MLCPRCGIEAGEARSCPACGTSIDSPKAPIDPEPSKLETSAPPSSPTAVESEERTGLAAWKTTFIVIGVAAGLGAVAGWIAKTHIAAPAPECEQLCQFADVPMIASNPNFQQQVQQLNCDCSRVARTPGVIAPMQPQPAPQR